MLAGCVGEIGCFGKLPLSPEFIRVNAKGATLDALDQWIQEGLLWCRAKIGPQWRNDFLNSETWNFLFQIPKQKEWLIGVIVPSQDKAGRVFPMMVFYRLFENNFGDPKNMAMFPLLFQDFLEKAKKLLHDEWKLLPLVKFREQVGQLFQANPLKPDQMNHLYDEFLHSYSLKTFLNACGVACQNLTEPEVRIMVQDIVKENRPSITSQMGKLMTFPLIHEPAFPFEIPFWMDYVSCMNGKDMAASLLLWNKCPNNGRATFLTQDFPVAPKSFWSLLYPNKNLESSWTMRSMDESETLLNEMGVSLGILSNANLPDNTLHCLLERQRI